ncbi:MAG TPA: YciI family protein [Thermoanaerobaculia bacterium]|nr:YciI family protein [Thermoanaerobaculia bacterium]
MRYMLLIYDREVDWAKLAEKDKGVLYQEYGAFTEGIKKSGHYKAGDPLEPTSKAATVRVRNGKTVTTDGPFAETREQLGGYYIVAAKDLAEASSIAARIPTSRTGSIEVRPILEMAG